MKPLVFLLVRSLFNGFKRAVTSGRRLVSLVLVIGYYVLVFIRPFDHSADFKTPKTPITNFPAPSTLDPWVFAAFLGLTALLSFGVFGAKGGFRQADIDVLFTTPVSPKVVLVFRLVRDYLGTLLMPLFFALIGWRGTTAGFLSLFRHYPVYGNYIIRTMLVAWLLLALVWTALSYAASLFVNRNDLTSARNGRIIAVIAYGPILIFLAYLSISLRADLSVDSARHVLDSPLSRILFPTATAAAAFAMSPLTGNFLAGGIGLVALIGFGVLALTVAMGQADWMYDQAAAKAVDVDDLKAMQKKGDMMAIYADRARRGKMRTGWIARNLAKVRVHGPLGIVWKDLLLTARTSAVGFLMMVVIFAFALGMMFYATSSSSFTEKIAPKAFGGLIFGSLAFFTFIITSTAAQQGFIELLRRVDVTKSLPFSPQVSVFYEIVGKTVPASLLVIVFSLVLPVIRLSLWDDALSAIITLPVFGVMLMSVSLVGTMLFPDVDDPTQRGLRGLVQMLGLVITAIFPAGIMAASYVFSPSPLIGAIPALLVTAAITLGCTVLSGTMYATYNPTE